MSKLPSMILAILMLATGGGGSYSDWSVLKPEEYRLAIVRARQKGAKTR